LSNGENSVRGRSITKGRVEGEAIVTKQAFMFSHGIDPRTGVVTDKRHELYRKNVKGKVFVFPYGKGSTSGSNWILETIRCGNFPIALINIETEPIIAIGVILGELIYEKTTPTMDRLERNPLEFIQSGDRVVVDSAAGVVLVRQKRLC
jgi:predicted aconitase with swiveling domain